LRAEKSGKSRVAIIGTGRVGTDLLYKALSSPHLDPVLFVGRNHDSEGLRIAKDLGVEVSSDGVDFLRENSGSFDYVFDATSAQSHRKHNAVFQQTQKFVVDLTPAKVGTLCVPSINLADSVRYQNVNMITCGGQAALPLAHAIRNSTNEIDYIEVVSSISSKSSGLATRENIDEYLTTTESSLILFSKARRTKAILNINPAYPDVCMQTSIYAYAKYDDFEKVAAAVAGAEEVVKRYVPGYEIVLRPVIDKDRITLSLTVHGKGDYLPKYAGNLDIINCAAIAVAEHKHMTDQGKDTQH
jgi:acetaldehyde dehydrogenase